MGSSRKRIVSLMSEHSGSKHGGGKNTVGGEGRRAGILDVTAFTRSQPSFGSCRVDEWYNQRSRGTPVLDERGRGRETRPPTISPLCVTSKSRKIT